MAKRALIIAIENYPQVEGGPAKTLPGTLDAAKAFEQWLQAKWKADRDEEQRAATTGTAVAMTPQPPETVVWFCSEPKADLGRGPEMTECGASLNEITSCLRKLRTVGANSTEELFVFFSGHGLTFNAGATGRTDYLLTSDFQSTDTPHCCLNFDGLVVWLRDHLGPGVHYYFVDACRNVVTPADMVPGPFPLGIDPQSAGEPSTFVLQSTFQGATASASTAFPEALLDGLRGAGRSKRYRDDLDNAMVVHYGSLREYIAESMRGQRAMSKTTGDTSEADAVLATIRPIPRVTCTVRVDQAAPGDTGVVLLRRGPRGAFEQRPLALPETVLVLEPDLYFIGVGLHDGRVDPDRPVKTDVFGTTVLTFTKTAALSLGGALGMAPPEELDRTVTRSRGLQLEAVESPPVWAASEIHASIASQFPRSDKGVYFSESLGDAVTDPDLDVWLAILGGGRILPRWPGQVQQDRPAALV